MSSRSSSSAGELLSLIAHGLLDSIVAVLFAGGAYLAFAGVATL